MPEIFDIIPATYAFGGDTIARLPDGRVVFIPFSIPGEKVRIELVESKPGFTRARLLEVLEPSPQRLAPPCPHFGECGGCQYQHLTYPAQLAAKSEILKDQLRRIGGIPDPQISALFPSRSEYDYRNHIQLQVAPSGALGYNRPRSNKVLPIRECRLPEAPINDLWPLLHFEPGSGIERVALRLGLEADLQVILESTSPEPPEINIEDLPVSVVHLSPNGSIVLAGSPEITLEVLDRRFLVSAASFFQTNTAVAEDLVSHLLDILEGHGVLQSSEIALDLYSGVGLFSLFLAPHLKRLIAVESSPSAVEDFAVNLNEFDNVEIYEAAVELALPSFELRPDFILVDPPREGLDRRATDALIHLASPLIVYVSCDPATLARDAKRLGLGGYELSDLALFDQFPQTSQIESMSVWELR